MEGSSDSGQDLVQPWGGEWGPPRPLLPLHPGGCSASLQFALVPVGPPGSGTRAGRGLPHIPTIMLPPGCCISWGR